MVLIEAMLLRHCYLHILLVLILDAQSPVEMWNEVLILAMAVLDPTKTYRRVLVCELAGDLVVPQSTGVLLEKPTWIPVAYAKPSATSSECVRCD